MTWPLRKFSAATLPRAVVGGWAGIRCDDLVGQSLDQAGVADLLEALFLHDDGGFLAGFEHLGEDVLTLFGVDLASVDEVDEFIERLRADGAIADGFACIRERAEEVVDNPVCHGFWLLGAFCGILEICGEREIVRQYRGIVFGHAEVVDVARALLPRKFGLARLGDLENFGRLLPEANRGPGNSGNRARFP